MAKASNFTDKLNSFKDRISNEKPEMNFQKVVPSTAKSKRKTPIEAEEQFGLKLPVSLIKNLKMASIEKDMSAKEIIIEALNAYLQIS